MIWCMVIKNKFSSIQINAGYCYAPLYIFCGKHLLAAKLCPSNVDPAAGALEEL